MLIGYGLLAAPTPAFSADQTIVYGGRLVNASGAPVSGPLALQVRFFHDASGGSPVGNIALQFNEVNFVDGLFQLDLKLSESEWHQILPGVNTPVYIEIENITYGGKFPRQLYNVVPYALKIPVDQKSITYNSQGQLALKVAAPNANGQVLSSTTDGTLSWVTPLANGGTGSFTSLSTGNSGISMQDNDGSQHAVTLKAPANLSANQTYVLPPAADAGKFLQTDAAGNLSWATMAAGVGDLNTDVYYNGASARSFYVARHPTADTAGQSLTISAGGATSGATDKTGGKLVLASGTSTGNAGSSIELQTASGGTAGTTDRSPTTKMTITGNGDVGIGTTSPTQLLTLTKNFNWATSLQINNSDAGASASSQIGLVGSGASLYLGAFSDASVWGGNTMVTSGAGDDLILGSDIQARMVIKSGGKVGIGTTSPYSKLDVDFAGPMSSTIWATRFTAPSTHGASYHGTLALQQSTSDTAAANTGSSLVFTPLAGPNPYFGLATIRGFKENATLNNQDTYLAFITRQGASDITTDTERMRIASSGNVGIGTTSPSYALDVNGVVRANSFISSSGASDWSNQGLVNIANLSIGTNSVGTDLFFGSGANREISVATQATAGNNLTIRAGGTSGTNQNGGDLILSSGTANGSSYQSKITFKTASGGAPADSMTILGSGNVGIGTTTPGSTLEVKGTFGYSDAAGTVSLGIWEAFGQVRMSSPNLLQVNGSGGLYLNSLSGQLIQMGGPVELTNNVTFQGNTAKSLSMGRHWTADTAGNSLTVAAGGATSGATDKAGGTLVLSAGTATGSNSSTISFQTATPGSAGTADRTPTTKMTILGNGNVGVGTTDPSSRIHISGGGSTSYYAGFETPYALITGPGFVHSDRGQLGVYSTDTVGVGKGGIIALGGKYFGDEIRTYGTIGAFNEQGDANTSGYLTLSTMGNSGYPVERLRISSTGNVGIGTTANASALLDVASTTKGFLPPRMTTVQRDAIASPATGLVVYNTTLSSLNHYTGTAWEEVGSTKNDELWIVDQKASGTDAGGSTSGSWATRTLNTTLKDTGSNLVSLSSNEFTLAPGAYDCDIQVPGRSSGGHLARLYNVSDTTVVARSLSGNSSVANDWLTFSAQINITANKTYRVEHRVESSQATDGLGKAANITGESEQYTSVYCRKN